MNSVLMRSMNDSYIKNPFSLPCLPRVPSEYLAGFSFSVSLSLLSVLPPRILCSSFPSVFFVLFFLSPFAFRLFSPYLCSAGGRRACAFPLSFSFPFLARRGFPAVRECPCGSSIRPFRLSGCGPFASPAGPFCGAFPSPPPLRPAWPLAPCNPFSHFPMFRAVCALRAAPRPPSRAGGPSRVGPIWQGAPFPSRPPFCLFLRKLSPSGPKKSPVFLAVRLFCATFASAFALKRAVCPRGRRSLKGFT